MNINDRAQVRLTPYGRSVLIQFWDNLNLDAAKMYSILFHLPDMGINANIRTYLLSRYAGHAI